MARKRKAKMHQSLLSLTFEDKTNHNKDTGGLLELLIDVKHINCGTSTAYTW